MEPSPVTASILSVLLGVFISVNLQNIFKNFESGRNKHSYAEIQNPRNIFTGLATVGTISFFLEVILYIIIGYTGIFPSLDLLFIELNKKLSILISYLGLGLEALGVYLFLWSVLARGRYSVSWEMPEDHKLIITGPYHYIRHPSYTGYFIMFIGFTLLWQNLVTFVPWIAIIGYIKIVETEEKLLITRFGDNYLEYAKSTGRFLPKVAHLFKSNEE